MSNTVDKIIQRVTQLAQLKGETPTASMNASGVGKNFFFNMRGGSTPSVGKIEQLAAYFDVTADYLLGRTDTPTPVNKKDTPAEVSRDAIKFALFGDANIDDELMDEVEDYARFAAARKRKQGNDNTRKTPPDGTG